MPNDIIAIISIIITILGLCSLLVLLANIYFKKFSSLVDRVVELDDRLPAEEREDFFRRAMTQFDHLKFPLISKRIADIIGSGFFLVTIFPCFFLVGLLIKVGSTGPILSKKRRIGQNGRIFYQYTFRTEYFSKTLGVEEATRLPSDALKDKARNLTKVGKFLYQADLDQLPTLFNILVGDMSFVGRTPFLESHLTDDLFSPEEKAILLKFKPGVTSLWAISADRVNDDESRMKKLDLAYAFKWSPWLDLMILSRTIPIALARSSAF
jgi:lipopolysaccharide/colanic/teichoic acid biosynthesis glycosyltransferase